jgi:hypothetical protein
MQNSGRPFLLVIGLGKRNPVLSESKEEGRKFWEK